MPQQSVLITGCSEGGIGDSLARAFHRRGLRVFATARNLAKIEHLKTLGMDVLPLDVVDAVSIQQAVETVEKATGGTLNILVNNSGSNYSMPLLDTEVSTAKRLFDVNVHGLISVTKAFAPLLIASKGTVVNIGSVVGLVALPWQGYYNASKAAVNLLTDQLRIELAPFGVKAILIVTGNVRTKLFDNQPSVTLPANSFYAPGRTEIEHAAAGGTIDDSVRDADSGYAESVVSNVLKQHPKTLQWAGGSATMIWFVSTFLWHTIWVSTGRFSNLNHGVNGR